MKLILPLVICAIALQADDFSHYKRLGKQSMENLIRDTGFEERPSQWNNMNSGGWKVAAGAGRNGSRGLINERKNPNEYILIQQKCECKPNTAYRFGGWIKTENLTGRGASICVEWSNSRTKQWLGGSYLGDINGTRDWYEIQGKFVMRKYPEPVNCYITIYLRKGSKGSLAFDDIYIYPDTAEWNAGILHPIQETLSTRDTAFELASFISGEFRYEKNKTPSYLCNVEISDGEKTFLNNCYPIKENRIHVNFKPLPPGEKQLKLTLLDKANQIILAEKELSLDVIPEAEMQKRKVRIDQYGRTLLDGKPFLPIGIYMRGLTKKDIDTVAEAGFNTILPYNSPTLGFDGKKGPDAIREVLDYCHRKNLKVVFSIKDAMPKGATDMPLNTWNGISDDVAIGNAIVKAFRNHPALLAWYICDEVQPTYIDALKNLRRRINRMDPDHPTFAVHYQVNSFERYLGGHDIFGVDPYPILTVDSRDQKNVIEQVSGAAKIQRLASGGILCWAVPQYMNWGVYKPDAADPKVYFKKYRFPTTEELYAMISLEMIHGIKGFIGYYYACLFYGPDKKQFEKAWPVIKTAVDFQYLMKPFLLSVEKAPAFRLLVRKGEVYAQTYQTEDGRKALLVSCVGPGESEAEIRMEDTMQNTEMHHGSFTRKDANTWIFHGNDIDSGLLYTK